MSSSDEEAQNATDPEVNLATFDPSAYRSRTGSFNSSALGHRYSPEKLEWDVVECTTETGEGAKVEQSTNTLSLIGIDWETVTVTAEVTIPEWLYNLVTPEPADRDGEWSERLSLACWCRQTILRDSSPSVEVGQPETYELTLEVERQDIYQSLQLCPKLVRAGYTDAETEYASAAGQRLAEWETWSLKTDLKRTTNNLLHPETKSFEDDDDLPGPDHLVFVDFDRNPPGIYINGDHERIVAALDSDSNRGWEAAVRDVAYDTIEAEVWPQMILEAAGEVSEEGGPETAWKQGVIERFRERLYGEGTSYEDAVDNLYEDVSSPERMGRLMRDIDDAVQTRNDAPSHLNTLLQLVDNR